MCCAGVGSHRSTAPFIAARALALIAALLSFIAALLGRLTELLSATNPYTAADVGAMGFSPLSAESELHKQQGPFVLDNGSNYGALPGTQTQDTSLGVLQELVS